jgi:hypothetical protein
MLDFVSAGGLNTCFWSMHPRAMVAFIKEWVDAQAPRIEYVRVPLSELSYTHKEKSRSYAYAWNRHEDDFDEELPFVHSDKCPANPAHTRTGKDLAGRVRCFHKQVKLRGQAAQTELY